MLNSLLRSIKPTLLAMTAMAVAFLIMPLQADNSDTNAWTYGRPVKAASGEVLILAPTVTGGLSSLEAAKVIAVGKTPVIITGPAWSALTTADFAQYDAIVIGDPTCDFGSISDITNALQWGPAITGNVVIIGTDPVFHSSFGPGGAQGGDEVTAKGIEFAVADAPNTGAYITLSCLFHGVSSATAVDFLDDAFGSPGDFTVAGVGCFNDAHIVATHPALDGLTDANLSNWSCSVHEAFDGWPADFQVLAIARNAGPVPLPTFPDGSAGTPYIIARGEGLRAIQTLEVTPLEAENPVGTVHVLTAIVLADGDPLEGATVTFEITAGPSAPLGPVDVVTDVNGEASFSWTGTVPGTDTIVVTYDDGTETHAITAQKTWIDDGPPPPTGGGEGCTPGFWANHTAVWGDYETDDDYSDTFGVTASFDATLIEAAGQGGGGEMALGRHAVAALLNASSPDVSYDLSVADVIALVQDAYGSGDFETAKDTLEVFNEQGCPINGKREGETGKPEGSGGKGRGR